VGEFGDRWNTRRSGGPDGDRDVVPGMNHRLRATREPGSQRGDPMFSDPHGLRAGGDRGEVGRYRSSTGVKQDPCVGDRRIELHRAEAQRRVHGHHDPACAQHAIEHHRERGPVWQHHADAITGFHAAVDEIVGEAGDIGGQHRIGRRHVVASQHGDVGVASRRLCETQAQIRHDHSALAIFHRSCDPRVRVSMGFTPTGLAC
jgi:hypothetical protein